MNTLSLNFAATVFYLLLSVESQIAESNLETRITGGQEAEESQFIFSVAVHVQTNSSYFFCGGTLITGTLVLTAGFCVNNAANFTVQLGSNSLTKQDANRLTLTSSQYFLHPEFNPVTLENDVGIIKLPIIISSNTYMRPTNLPRQITADYTNVTFMGWGQTSDSDTQLSEQLRYAEGILLSNADCKSFYGDKIMTTMACVQGNANEGTCIGDNGGPLIEVVYGYYFVAGIASFISTNGCESTDPSGYTLVYPYLDWIRSCYNN